jgi:hypothetical protein
MNKDTTKRNRWVTYLSDEDQAKLTRLKDATGMGESTLLRLIVNQYLNSEQAKIFIGSQRV